MIQNGIIIQIIRQTKLLDGTHGLYKDGAHHLPPLIRRLHALFRTFIIQVKANLTALVFCADVASVRSLR